MKPRMGTNLDLHGGLEAGLDVFSPSIDLQNLQPTFKKALTDVHAGRCADNPEGKLKTEGIDGEMRMRVDECCISI
jgi:hypothetical protein